MSVDKTKLVIPGHGTVFKAPKGTKPPTDPMTAFSLTAENVASASGGAKWINLGHTSKQNTIAFTKEGGDKESLDSFLADGVRTSTSSTQWGVNVAALQIDPTTLDLAFQGAFDPDTGGYTVAGSSSTEVALFLFFQDTTGSLGFWIPNVDTSIGDAPSVDTANFFELPLAGSILSADANVIPPVRGRAGIYQIFSSALKLGTWTSTADFTAGALIALAGGEILEATTAGKAGTTAPAAPAVGATVVDGTVTWRRIQ